MPLSFLYRLLRRLLALVRVHQMDALSKDAEWTRAGSAPSVPSPSTAALTELPGSPISLPAGAAPTGIVVN
jgi:hypothetical protein